MSNFGPDVLDKRVLEIVRTLPDEQAGEIKHFGAMLHDEATHLEYGVYNVSLGRYDTPRTKYSDHLPQIISKFAMDNFEIADAHDFPVLSPRRAMRVSRITSENTDLIRREVGRFTDVLPREEDLTTSSVGLVGLQAAILGEAEILLDDDAIESRRGATVAYAEQFVAPIYARWIEAQKHKARSRI